MIQGLYSALSAVVAGERSQAVSANNVANINSVGYKAKYTVLSDLSQGGVKVLSVNQNNSQGYYIHTGRPLDLAINGEGYFKVYNEEMEKLTRAGNFYLDKNGDIVTADGFKLAENLNITPADNVKIGVNGEIFVNSEPVFNIDIFDSNYNMLPENSYEIMSGFVEASNVDLAREIISQIVDLRFVQTNSKTIKTTDEMLGYILDIKS